jgi:hypothetical protein
MSIQDCLVTQMRIALTGNVTKCIYVISDNRYIVLIGKKLLVVSSLETTLLSMDGDEELDVGSFQTLNLRTNITKFLYCIYAEVTSSSIIMRDILRSSLATMKLVIRHVYKN